MTIPQHQCSDFCTRDSREPIDEIVDWTDVYDKRRVDTDGDQRRGKQEIDFITKREREGGV